MNLVVSHILIRHCLFSSNTTPKTASFSGSMQLLAGVKLCTGRPITNHPHYEDKGLRKRTKEVRSKRVYLCYDITGRSDLKEPPGTHYDAILLGLRVGTCNPASPVVHSAIS